MNELFWRIWTAAVLVTGSVLALFVLLATLQFQSINASLTSDRLAVLADRTAEPFKAPARIGLPLSTVRNSAALLERARQTDPQILSVQVFDASGRIVHSTATPAPARLSPHVQAALLRSDNGRWKISDSVSFISGVNIRDSSGELAGGVIVEYPATGHRTQVRAMAAELGFAAIGGLAMIALVGAAALRLALKHLFRNFERVETEIGDFERAAWRSAAGADVARDKTAKDNAPTLLAALPEAETRYRQIGKTLANLEPEPEARP